MLSDGLFELLEKAKKDSSLRKKILDTKKANDPELALCELATELDCAITVGEIYQQGQRYLADLEDGCLGSTPPREKWGDTYEQFMASIEGMEEGR
ncbi:hypothetical protein [Anaerotignum sp. MB30-C6]|uniref:hypothetical protein n=1 Tax=Anaerotignum sp. MB30-C6 TaxID=3070814 RepID=UPI0027DDE3B0|nr:hypothetical protein [Anaerotignum sp. MB30-C6]WMI80819.1 hypothetical protein RBQ60_13510 [Anaerotignum sp. MB30-C6]